MSEAEIARLREHIREMLRRFKLKVQADGL